MTTIDQMLTSYYHTINDLFLMKNTFSQNLKNIAFYIDINIDSDSYFYILMNISIMFSDSV
jgi:hypothetical protein